MLKNIKYLSALKSKFFENQRYYYLVEHEDESLNFTILVKPGWENIFRAIIQHYISTGINLPKFLAHHLVVFGEANNLRNIQHIKDNTFLYWQDHALKSILKISEANKVIFERNNYIDKMVLLK